MKTSLFIMPSGWVFLKQGEFVSCTKRPETVPADPSKQSSRQAALAGIEAFALCLLANGYRPDHTEFLDALGKATDEVLEVR